jgi:hypothetical protein
MATANTNPGMATLCLAEDLANFGYALDGSLTDTYSRQSCMEFDRLGS